MEGHPEENDHEEHQAECHDAFLGVFRREFLDLFGGFRALLLAFHVAVELAESVVDDDGDDQGGAGDGEGEMVGGILAPAHAHAPFLHLDGCGRGEKGADVDGHVEEAEAGVALVGVFRIVVEVTDHNLQVALEEAGAETDQRQRQHHEEQGGRPSSHRDGQEEIAEEHHGDADHDHLAETEFVGEDASHEREEIHQTEESTVNETGRARAEAEVGLQEQGEDSDHRVVAKPFTGIGQREREESLGLSFEHILLLYGNIR